MTRASPHRALWALWLLLVCSLSAHAYTVSEIAKVDGLLAVLSQRLEIAESVAQAKWNSGAAIEDPEREAQVLDRFGQQARERGVDEKFARSVMRAQIEASKVRQRAFFALWKQQRQGPFSDPPDLAGEIRPQLDLLSDRLIASLQDSKALGSKFDPLLSWRAQLLWKQPCDTAQVLSLSPFATYR